MKNTEMAWTALAAAALGLSLAGCVTDRQSNPPRTATEELLISSAVDRAADQLQLHLPPGTKIFVDTSNFDGTDAKYAIGQITDRFLRQGAAIVGDKKAAQVVVAIRSGALSTNSHKLFIGLPALPIPIPFSATAITTPEVAIYEKDEDHGIAKFAATGYDPASGRLVTSTDPALGFSDHTEYTAVIFISWQHDDLQPPEANGKEN